MAITGFFNRTILTKRLTGVGGGSNRQTWQTNLVDIPAAIHPANPELFTVQDSAFYNQFKMFCGKTNDIEIGDQVIDGSDIYSVLGKALFDDFGGRNNEHMRLTIMKGQ